MGKETRVVVVSRALRLFGRLKGDKKGEREKGKITHTSPVLHDRSFFLSLEHILTDNNKSFGIHWDKIVKKKSSFFSGVFVAISCYHTAENNHFFLLY